MTSIDFFSLFSENTVAFFVIATIVIAIFVIIANKLADSWLNPIKFNVFQAGIGIAVACYIYYLGEATLETFLYVIFSSILFWSVLCFLYPKKPGRFGLKIKNEGFYSYYLFLVIYFGNIALQLFSYARFGIPIFNDDSRLSTFTGSGGFGVISRLNGFFRVYSMFFIFNRYITNERTNWPKLILWLAPLILFGVLSGSRSSFLAFIFGFWGFKQFYRREEVYLSNFKALLVPFVIVAVLTFALEHSTNIAGGVLSFLERVMACGDLYWEAMPNDTWADVTIKTPFKDLLVGFLGPLRILPESSTDVPIGYQLTQIVQGYDKMTGPVELFPISSLIYFGYWGGIIMVIVQALLACFFVKLFYRHSDSLIFSSLLYYAFYDSIYFVGSLRNATGQLFDILLNIAFVAFLCFCIGLLESVLQPSSKTFSKV